MGFRAVEKIGSQSEYRMILCEEDKRKAEALEHNGFRIESIGPALKQADFVVLAVPDEAIGHLTDEFVPRMKDGAALIALDAAAAYAGQIPTRAEITQLITHPCHPPFSPSKVRKRLVVTISGESLSKTFWYLSLMVRRVCSQKQQKSARQCSPP